MNKKNLYFPSLSAVVAAALFIGLLFSVSAAAPQIRTATLGDPIGDLTLPSFQRQDISFSSLIGKNIVLIFTRGLYALKSWCHVCPHPYVDFADFDQKTGFRKNLYAEILFVLPYDRAKVGEWVDAIPGLLADIESWRNPSDPQNMTNSQKRRKRMVLKYFPKSYTFEKGKVPLPFPILIDAERKLSKGLDLFRTEWSGSKAPQNVPAVYVIDKAGIVRFKYISQNTFDRPGPEYIENILRYLVK